MKWLRDATDVLEQEDSLLNKGLNNSFLKLSQAFFVCFFINPSFLFTRLELDRPRLFQMIVSDEFLKQRDTEAFLKFNSGFSTEFAR